MKASLPPADDDHLRGIYLLQERDRRLLAYDLHDGIVQDLVAAKMTVEGLLADLDAARAIDRDQLARVGQLLGRAVVEGRRLISNLRPLVLDEQDLYTAIDYLVQEWATRESFRVQLTCCQELPPIDLLTKNILFRIVQEGLTNAFRHSGQDTAYVALQLNSDQLVVTIVDHGQGFDREAVPADRLGLVGIYDRARLLRGQATISSQLGHGTTIEVRVPCPVSSR